LLAVYAVILPEKIALWAIAMAENLVRIPLLQENRRM
jgi:hypothetical protein